MVTDPLLVRIIRGGRPVLEEVLRFGITQEDFPSPVSRSTWDLIQTYYRADASKGSVVDETLLRRRLTLSGLLSTGTAIVPDIVLGPDRPNLTLDTLCRETRSRRLNTAVSAALIDCSNALSRGWDASNVVGAIETLRGSIENVLKLAGSAGTSRRGIADVLTTPLPPARWIVEELGLQAGPLVLLAGYGDSAKSMSAQAAILALSSATESLVWGRYARAKRCRCLHLDYEQGNVETARRYQRLTVGLGLCPDLLAGWLEVDSSPAKLTTKNKAFFEMCARDRDVVLIDSFSAATRSAGIDENSQEAAVPLDMLNDISEQTGCLFLVVHHAGKGTRDDVREVARGSSAIFAAAGGMFAFVRDAKRDAVDVTCAKPRNGRRCASFTLQIEDTPVGGITVMASSAASKAAGELQAMIDRVVAHLEHAPNGSWTGSVSGWKRELGVSNGKHTLLQQALGNLRVSGRMTATPLGGSGQKTTYALTPLSAALPMPGQADHGVVRPPKVLPMGEHR